MQPSSRTLLSLGTCTVLLVLLAIAGAAGLQPAANDAADETQPRSVDNVDLPERVILPGPHTSGAERVGIDGGAALDRSGSRLSGAYDRYLLEERLSRADDTSERQSILNRSAAGIESSVDRLHERERSARLAYRNGEMDEEAYLSTLRSINDEATQLEERAFLIAPPAYVDEDGLADEHDAPAVANRISTLHGDIVSLRGPVRSSIGESTSGETSPQRFHVATSSNGTVVSVLSDGVYQREAIRTDLLASRAQTGISLSEANDLAETELYPTSLEQYTLNRRIQSLSPRRVYLLTAQGQFDANGNQGMLESYIDSVSQTVYWEYQRIDVGEGVPLASPVTNASGNVSVDVHPTYPTGPAQVTVTADGSAAPNLTVFVDGEPVAETGDDGLAWVVLPREDSTVAVTLDGETVEVPIAWPSQDDAVDGDEGDE